MFILSTAIRFIRFDKAKSIGVTIGIIISTFLIGQQLGILNFLTGLMVTTAKNSNAQIWVIDESSTDINQLGRLDIRKLNEVRSIVGVKEAHPIVLAGGSATYPSGSTASLLLIGSEGPNFPAGPKMENIKQGNQADLQQDLAISSDFFDSETLGGTTEPGTPLEINGKQAKITVQTNGVRGFGAPIAYTTIERARFYGNIPSTSINGILVNVTNDFTVKQVVDNINGTLSGVRAWPVEDLKESTISTVLSSSGIAVSTGSLIVFALISGFFIIGLTLYSSALDRLRDYGTLKAIGAKNSHIRKLILTQAFLFAVVGFVIAFILLELFRKGVANTGLIFTLSPLTVLGMFAVIIAISMGSSAFALKRIKGVEPASVFR